FARVRAGDLRDLRGHRATGAAPRRPEVDEHGDLGVTQHLPELVGTRDLQGLGGMRQRRRAGATSRLLPDLGHGYAVASSAVRTSENGSDAGHAGNLRPLRHASRAPRESALLAGFALLHEPPRRIFTVAR